ncbi:MAG: thioredoxin family protein [Candidatus Thorarchaeota archaeon]|jgi:thiol-disulfide isomerase/thioredoxin
MVDLEDIRSRTKNATEYMNSIDDKHRDSFFDMYEGYELDPMSTEKLRRLTKDLTLVVMSAGWCKDCKNALPVLMHLEEQIGLDVRIFGSVKTAPLDPDHQWRIPPSPPEIEDWRVTAIPWIGIFDSGGKSIATIIEKPAVEPTLEAELVHVLTKARA